MIGQLNRLGMHMNFTVRITRNLNLERSCLKQPSQIILRRHTFDPDLPFGFRGRRRLVNRGRKRTTNVILNMNVWPNLDERSLTNGMQQNLPLQSAQNVSTLAAPPATVPSPPTTFTQPAAFTYTRAARPTVRRLTFV